MFRLTPIILLAAAALAAAPASASEAPVFARMDTDMGGILLELAPDLAPHHVDNFIHLSETGFYDGTTFHRVIPGFMIQGGDPNSRDDDRANDGTGFPLWTDVLTPAQAELVARADSVLESRGYVGLGGEVRMKAEFSRESHRRGTLSMARAQQIDTAGSQFFICVSSALALDGKYTVFGRVVMGMDVVDAIVETPRDSRDNPLEKVTVRGIEIIRGEDGLDAREKEAWLKERSAEDLRR